MPMFLAASSIAGHMDTHLMFALESGISAGLRRAFGESPVVPKKKHRSKGARGKGTLALADEDWSPTMQTISLPDAVIDTAKRLTGKSRTPDAVRAAISLAESAAGNTPGGRFLRAATALREDARKKHPNGMTQAQVRSFIKKARREAAAHRP